MTLSKGWTSITPCSVGGREMLLFYNAVNGLAETYRLTEADELMPMATVWMSVGWTHIAHCNRLLLFYNAVNGSGAIGWIDYGGGFVNLTGFTARTFSLGWNNIASDGHALLFHRDSDGLMASATIGLSPPYPVPTFYQGDYLQSIPIATGQDGCSFAASRNQIVAFDPRGGTYISFTCTPDSTPVLTFSNFSVPWLKIASATIVAGTRDTLLFVNQFGGPSVVGYLNGDSGRFVQSATLTFSPFWSHVVGMDHQLVFYRAYDGSAFTGTITPAGDFVQQQTYS